MITDREIELLREEQLKFMPERGIIRRRYYMGDDRFSKPENVAIDVPCRITPGFGFWREIADRFQGVTPFTVTLPWDQDIKPGDIFVDDQSRTYEVRDVMAPKTYITARRALLDLVNDA